MYADNTSITYSSIDIAELYETLNTDLSSLKKWLEGTKLSLYVIETQVMVIASRPNLIKISDKTVSTLYFIIGDSHIDFVDNTTYLGVKLAKSLL